MTTADNGGIVQRFYVTPMPNGYAVIDSEGGAVVQRFSRAGAGAAALVAGRMNKEHEESR